MSIKLITNDGKTLEINKDLICKFSGTLSDLLSDMDVDQIPIPNVDSLCMEHVIEYINHHQEPSEICSDLKDKWNSEFRYRVVEYVIPDQEQPYMFLANLILTANYLNIKTLLDFLSKVYAAIINGLTPDEIKETFGVTDTPTKAEQEQIKKDNEWCNHA